MSTKYSYTYKQFLSLTYTLDKYLSAHRRIGSSLLCRIECKCQVGGSTLSFRSLPRMMINHSTLDCHVTFLTCFLGGPE